MAAKRTVCGGRDQAIATPRCTASRVTYDDHIARNPFELAGRPKVPEHAATAGLSKQRARRLITAARADGAREGLLVLLLLELGLRISEAVGANIEDLGEQGRHRVLHIKGKGQATKATPVPLNPSVSDAADSAAAGRVNGPLLITGTGARLTRQHAGKLITRLGEQIGLPHLHPTICATRSSRSPSTKAPHCAMSKTPLGTPTRERPGGMTATATASTGTQHTGCSARSSREPERDRGDPAAIAREANLDLTCDRQST
jgi:integrase